MMFMGCNKEVSDAEIFAIWRGLKASKDGLDEWARALGTRAVAVFTDVQAALKRIRNDDTGPANGSRAASFAQNVDFVKQAQVKRSLPQEKMAAQEKRINTIKKTDRSTTVAGAFSRF
jgi:hypothetical protein